MRGICEEGGEVGFQTVRYRSEVICGSGERGKGVWCTATTRKSGEREG